MFRRACWQVAFRIVALAVAIGGVAVCLWTFDLLTWPNLVMGLVTGLGGAALAGLFRPAAEPVRPAAPMVVYAAAPPTAPAAAPRAPLDWIQQAFWRAGVTSERDPVEQVGAAGHDKTGTWACTVDLGEGRTVAAALAKRDELASAFQVEREMLHLAKAGPRHVRVTIHQTDPLAETARSALGTGAPSSIWEPHRIGRDATGAAVTVSMVEQSILAGGLPRKGKTTLLQQLVVAAALDPTVSISIADGKGGGDWTAFEPLCDWWGTDDDISAVVAMLERAVATMRSTYGWMRERHIGQITPAMVAEGHRVRLIVVDEVQVFLDSVHRKEVLSLLADLARRGPAAGIRLIMATQRPDAETIPPVLRDQFGVKVALEVATKATQRTILGDAAATAEMVTGRGGAVVVGAEGRQGPVSVKLDLLDGDTLRQVIDRAGAGRPTWVEPDEPIEQAFDGGVAPDILAEVAAAFVGSENRLPTAELARRISRMQPHREGLDADALGLLLRGLVTSRRWGSGANTTRGFVRSEVEEAMRRVCDGSPECDGSATGAATGAHPL
jgi:S-DNA-T family DNA segregation ATPase FtsK/SpoIIIE